MEYRISKMYNTTNKNTLKYIPQKDKGIFASDLKRIYHASNEHNALML